MGIAPNPEILRIDYFFYFMKQLRMQDLAESTTVPSVRKSKLERVEIAVPSMEEQIEIERKIQLTDSIIQKRKQQLSALDNLIKARFVEMFGDPISNEREWPTAPLTDVCTRIFGGGTPSKSHPEYFEGTIPWVSPKDMKSDIITDSIDHITEDALANSTTNLVPEGSVLMVIRSGILKHALPVAINAIPVTINQDMKAFIPSKNITSNFLRNYFKAVEQDILVGVRGVTADNIDFKSFQQREIILPPIELQNLFSDFVVQVDKSKVVIQKALDEAQILFDSLMQQYFG